MAQVAAELAQATASTRYLSNFFKNCWDAFLERSERQRVRAARYDPSNRSWWTSVLPAARSNTSP